MKQSRNKTEGHYYGKVKGRYICCERYFRSSWKVSSWFAFRVWAERYINE